jgi:hypothetical protein
MTKEEHKKLGIMYFNHTWDLIDKENKTEEETLQMIHYAHASRLHWTLSEPPMINIIRGEWLISHVYGLLQLGESCLHHAEFVYQKTLAEKCTGFDLVFAYEAMARAFKLLGNTVSMNQYLEMGYQAIDQVEDKADKTYCQEQLDSIKK